MLDQSCSISHARSEQMIFITLVMLPGRKQYNYGTGMIMLYYMIIYIMRTHHSEIAFINTLIKLYLYKIFFIDER